MSEQTRKQRRPSSVLSGKVAAPASVLAGGLLGAAMRAIVGELFPVTSGRFPTTTLLVNLAGSLVLGLYLSRRQRAIAAGWSLRFWAIGGLGSFTTFSTFSAEVFRLIEANAIVVAVWYGLASLVGGVAAALLGERLGMVGR